ncbi:MAG TPA: PQQ-binding-like beta-propeller repeat protein, partial [Tepidisphaeraceae bacterium]|nr:PQQ-binding-like beta-propeller repeat protein [Tepidisphaeraceae bacterium]
WTDRMREGLSRDYKPASRGGVVCLDAKTGNPIWRKFLVEKPDNGAPVRGGFAYDGQSNTLYFTTGNNYAGEPTELAASIVAMNAGNGEVLWHFKPVRDRDAELRHEREGRERGETRSDFRGYDFVAAPNLFEAGGRRFVGAGSLDGRYYAIDRDNGQLAWSRQIGDDGSAGGIRECASFRDGRIYVWSNNNFDDTKSSDPASRPLTVACLDAGTGRIVWQKPNSQPAGGWSDGMLANDLYFVGSLDGTLQAYRASDGQVMWTGRVPDASVASSINVAGNALFVGAGLPKTFDGISDSRGVYCFSTGHRNAEAASAQMRGSE